jgi:hypothetical protein
MRDQVSWGFYIGNFTFMVGDHVPPFHTCGYGSS